jgi:hypothetical protein
LESAGGVLNLKKEKNKVNIRNKQKLSNKAGRQIAHI